MEDLGSSGLRDNILIMRQYISSDEHNELV